LVQIRLNDGGFMSIRPGTEMVIDRFHYDERKPAESGMLISLLRGGMRSITGLIGKANPDGYQIRSSTATVGIRGTDHEPMVIPPNVPELARLGAPGLYDKVNEGETFIRNQAGLLSIKRGEIGFTAANAPTVVPQALKVIPEFYRVELKVDARDPKDAASINTQGRTAVEPAPGGLLRPTTAARREALIQSGALTAITADVAVPDRTLSVTNVQPVGASNLAVPSAALTSSVTAVQPLSATTVTKATSTTLAVPLSSTLSTMTPAISSNLSSGALMAPAGSFTALSPSVTSSVSSNLVAPASATSVITNFAPAVSSSLSTSTVSTSRLIAPAVTTSTVLTPTTAITPTLSTTTIAPALSTTTIKILK
jgi:hypothetical protein